MLKPNNELTERSRTGGTYDKTAAHFAFVSDTSEY